MRHIGAWYREEPGNRGGNHGDDEGCLPPVSPQVVDRERSAPAFMPGPNLRRHLNDPGIAKLKISHSMRVSECRRRLGSLGFSAAPTSHNLTHSMGCVDFIQCEDMENGSLLTLPPKGRGALHRRHPAVKILCRMRFHGVSALLLVACGWIDECYGFAHSLRPASCNSVARTAAARMLDIVVEGDKPRGRSESYVKEELPDYMKSKRRMYPRKCDVMDEIEYFVQEKIDQGLLLNKEKAWQPSDFLPDSQKPTEEWIDEVREIREAHADVPDEILLVLIGDMVTEEALPTYLTLLNTLEGTDDPTGAVDTAWGRWSRQWTAEENRHGDLLNRYLYLGGRADSHVKPPATRPPSPRAPSLTPSSLP